MPTTNHVLSKGYNAGAALTKGRAVKFSAAETVIPVAATTDLVAGVARYSVSAGDITRGVGAQVDRIGSVIMEASEAIAVNQGVSITTDGRAQVVGAGERQIGICDEAASGAGKYCRVTLTLPGTIVA